MVLTLTASGVEPPLTHAGSDKRPKADYKEGHLPGTNDSISHLNLTKAQIDAVRGAIAKLKFPLPSGTVDRLLPVQKARSGADIGDVISGNGLLAIYVWHYELSLDYVLLVRQGHYAEKGAKPSRSHFRDESAKIVRRDKLPKF